MSNLTALQQAMRIVEQYAPQLFDTYNAKGRTFIDEMTKLLDVEREQIEHAFDVGNDCGSETPPSKYKLEFDEPSDFYNATYKGGEQ